MKKKIFIFCFLSLLISYLKSEIKIEKSKYMNWDSIIVDNGLIKIVILPDIGGRIVEFYSYLTNHNLIRVAPWFLEILPDKLAQTGEYGGICDIGSLGWPGYFWDKKYDFDIKKEKEEILIIGKCISEDIYIERKMEVKENSSKIKFIILMKNLSEKSKELVPRLHGEFRVGEKADENDVFYWVDNNKLLSRRYKPSDLIRFSIDKTYKGWCGIVDEKEKEALIKRFYPMGKQERIFWWAGFLEGDPKSAERDDKGGFYNFDRYPEPILVQPGNFIEIEEDLFTVVGLNSINFVNEEIVFGFKVSKKIVGDEGFYIDCGIACCEKIEDSYKLELTIEKEDKVYQKKETFVKNLIPGKTNENRIFFDTKNLKDGNYLVRFKLLKNDEILEDIVENITVDKKLIEKYKLIIKEEENYIKKIADKKNSFYMDLRELLNFLTNKQKEDFEIGNYQEIEKRHERFIKYIQIK